MFEKVAEALTTELKTLTSNRSDCLCFSLALLRFCRLRQLDARPLVVRGVAIDPAGASLLGEILPVHTAVQLAIRCPSAEAVALVNNERVEFTSSLPDRIESDELVFAFKTLGISHGDEYVDGAWIKGTGWIGHLVIIIKDLLVDLCAEQFGKPEYNIIPNRSYLVTATTGGFLDGSEWLHTTKAGPLLLYKAHPTEQTFTKSNAWTNPAYRTKIYDIAARVAKAFEPLPDQAMHECIS